MSIEILAQVIYKKNIDLVVGGKLNEEDLFSNMNEHMQTLMDFIESFGGSSKAIPTKTENNLDLNCPNCGKADNFEDNRAKRNSDIKFSKIPVFSCSNYKNNQGCGWKTWDEDVMPSMMSGFVAPLEPVAKPISKDNSVAPF